MDESHTTHSSKPNPWMMSTLALVGVVVGFSIAQVPYFKSLGAASVIPPTPPAQQLAEEEEPPPPPLTAEQIADLPDDDTVLGDPNAPVTVVEFSDFECPYCEGFFNESYKQIKENYINTGKVKFVYRDYPIQERHPNAQLAAEVAECADDQGKFSEMHDKLFGTQIFWSRLEKPLEEFKKYAAELKLNAKEFDECVTSQKYASEVRKDLLDAYAVGVRGTPAFFINGKFLSGAVPYEQIFKPILDAELEGKEWELKRDPANPRRLIVEVK